ncbi:two-component regulator propeller domain-containing protein [Hydrogenophaga taeniospiralis]|uniref:two-component regulator propeller domain-containing protein n=1 Tax=Hydrogenophaga taeniospiralis TaxID=65656 RepID=UPI0009FED868|nr:two-component regulator propeller domain-containing protein [Hydrogenophaga taeniospiralis]
MNTKAMLKKAILLAAIILVAEGVAGMETNPQEIGESNFIEKNSKSPYKTKKEVVFSRLTIEDGLSQSDVRAIVQDQQGFMWFGTWLGGLNRYDGYTFKSYKHNTQSNQSLSNDNVWTLFVDRGGDLWVGTIGGGMNRYDPKTDSFERYRFQPNHPTGLPSDDVKAFYEDEAGMLWIATGGGLSRFDRKAGTFFTYKNDPKDPTSLSDNDVRAIWRDQKTGLLWLGTRKGGVNVLDPSTGRFTRYQHKPDDPTSLSNNVVTHIFQDRAGTVWISTRGKLNRFDAQTKTFAQYHSDPNNPDSISDDEVTMAYEDRAGHFWVATNNGLNLLDREKGTFVQYHHDPHNPDSLGNSVINSGALYEDRSGALWIGTIYNGVSRLPGEPGKFITYRNNPGDTNSLSHNNVTGIHVDKAHNVWIGTETGLDRFDGQTFTHYRHDPKNPKSLSPGTARTITEDAQGRLWIGTNGGGISRFDGQQFIHYRNEPDNPKSLAGNLVKNIAADAKGGLWIGMQGLGLDYFDGQNFVHFKPDKEDPNSLPDPYIYALFVGQNGVLWIGTVKRGLVRYDPATGTFTNYLLDPEQPGNQAANWVQDIYSDQTGLWVGASSGLFRFDPLSEKFTHHYTEKDGLASSSIVGVRGDAQGNLWVSTTNGLSRFDPKNKTFRNYDAHDGLQSNEFSRIAHAQSPDGQLFFGGVKGLSAFNPDKMMDNPTPPPVVLTSFSLFNKPVEIGGKDSPLQQAINVAPGITLRHDQSVFRFQFAALNYTAPKKNRYAYLLEGFDTEWRYTDAENRFATYTNLDPGVYRFRVKASNNDGLWNEEGAALTVQITPPWWATWWFLSLALTLLLGLAFSGYRLRIMRLRRYSQKLERDVTERTAELAAKNKELEAFSHSVSHDLRAPVRHIDGYLSLLRENIEPTLDADNRKLIETIASATNHMGTLIDDLLSFSRMGRQELSKTSVDLGALVADVVQEMAPETEGREIDWRIGELPVVVGDQAMLRVVLVNLISNALKYTQKRERAEITIGCEPDQAAETVVFIRDNGAGFDMQYRDKLFGVFQRLHRMEDFQGTGIGLANVFRIISRHGGRARAEGAVDVGATFYFSLPKEKA